VRRFFVEEITEKDGVCSIPGTEARHITKVLRMGPGDRLVLMDRKGHHFLSTIQSATPREVKVVLEGSFPKPPPSPVRITLCQALIKSRQMDYVIQKASELGADRIFPFTSERTVVRFSKDRLINKMRHWQEIALSSAKQCGRVTPVEISLPSTFRDLIREWKETEGLKVILWEEEGAKDLKGLLRRSSQIGKFAGVVGPEGGFSRKEIEVARDAGFSIASLGSRILRSETAALALVALVQYEWGDLSLKTPPDEYTAVPL